MYQFLFLVWRKSVFCYIMSVLQLQEIVSDGKLEQAVVFISQHYSSMHFEREIYESIVYVTKGELNSALNSAMRSHDISKSSSDQLEHHSSHVAIAYALLKLGKLDEANYYIKLAEEGFTNNDKCKIGEDCFFWFRTLYQVKGGIKTRSGEIDAAIQSYEKCLELSLVLNNKGLIGGIYNNLGFAYNLIGVTNKAFEYYSKSLEEVEKLGNEYYKYYPLSNLGIYYYNKGDMANSEKYHTLALNIAQKIGNKSNIASQFRDMSQIFKYRGETKKALKYLQNSLDLREEIGNPIWLSFTLIYLIEISIDLEEEELARKYYSRLEEINLELKNNKLISQTARMAKALILKSKPRIKPKSEAMKIFKQIISEEMIDYDMTVNAILQFCDLLLFEIKLTNEEDVLIELHSMTAQLIQIAETNNSHILIGEILGLQANLAIIEGNYKHALYLYDQAIKLADKYESTKLRKKVQLLKNELISESEVWSNLTNGDNPIVKRIQKIEY